MAEMEQSTESNRRPGVGRPVGVVVAGGRSRRMGTDKALLPLDGVTLAERAAGRLAPICSRVLVADRGRSTVAGFESVPDGAGEGPAAGLLGAARKAPGRPLLVLGCDLPAVPSKLLAHLAELAEERGADLALPRSRRGLEPLAGYYGPRALASLGRQVAAGHYALRRLLEDPALTVVLLEGDALAAFGPTEVLFSNLNTPEELEAFRRHRGQSGP